MLDMVASAIYILYAEGNTNSKYKKAWH